jgi:hypothetical protein
MFNSYLYTKQQQKAKEKSFNMEKSVRQLEVQSQVRDKLLKKYKIRLAKKVVDLIENPVPINNRDRSPSPKYFGDSIMRQRPRDTKSRIHDAISHNTLLDLSPLIITNPDFRPRQKEKEIQLSMKFTPKDRFERLVDKYFSDNSFISTWEVSSQSTSPIRSKTKKLYYKTIETTALNVSPETCSKENSKALLRKISEESLKTITDENLGILAQEAMEKCRLRLKKDTRIVSVNRKV